MGSANDGWEDAPDDGWEAAPATAPAPSPTAPMVSGQSSAGGAFVRGVGNAFGFGDALGAGLQGALHGLSNTPDVLTGKKGPLDNARESWDVVKQAFRENRAETKRDWEQQPAMAFAGRLAPAVMLGPVLGGATSLEGATAVNAGLGGLDGLASSDADTIGGRLKDAGKGAVTSAVVGVGGRAAGELVGETVRSAAASAQPRFAKLAEIFALKGAGAIKSDLAKIPEARRPVIARDILEQNLFTRPRAEEVRKSAGLGMEKALSGADAATGGQGFNMSPVVQRWQAEIAAQGANNPVRAKAVESVLASLGLDPAQLASTGRSFVSANQIKSDIANATNFVDAKLASGIKRQLGGILDDEVERQLGAGLGKDALADYIASKRLYGSAKTAGNLLKGKMAREEGNRFFSPSDYGLGAVAGLSNAMSGPTPGAMLVGLGAAVGNKFARQEGPRLIAKGANALAKSDTLNKVANASPAGFGSFVSATSGAAARGLHAKALAEAVERNPALQARYGEVLKGDVSAGQLAYYMQTDPELRQAVNGSAGGGGG